MVSDYFEFSSRSRLFGLSLILLEEEKILQWKGTGAWGVDLPGRRSIPILDVYDLVFDPGQRCHL